MYLICLDLQKALDTVDRQLLLNKMVAKGFPNELTKSIFAILSQTSHLIQASDIRYHTNIGVP